MSYTQFTEADEGLHPASDHPLWQESVLLHWYDAKQGIGGWHRVGREPNNQGGRGALWSYLFSKDGGWQFRHCGEVVLDARDRYNNGFRSGEALSFTYEDGSAKYRIREADLSADLECRNLFPLVDPFPKNDEVAAKRFAHHFEVAGRVTGSVTHKGKTVQVNGFGYRDHSWSERDWNNGMLGHRWFTGVLGDGELSFGTIVAQSREGKLTRVGFIARGGKIKRAVSSDIVAHIEPDGLTHRGGELWMRMEDGEEINIRCKPVAGVLFQRGTVVMVEMMCEAEGHGLKGYCDAEISSNPRAGIAPVRLSINADMEEGFSPYTPLKFR